MGRDGERWGDRLLHQRHLGPQPHLVEVAHISRGDVGRCGEMWGDVGRQPHLVEVPHAVAVDRDRASLRVVEAQQQREGCALAAAARPH